MAGQRMRCPKCKNRFTRPSGSSRLYCETCSPPRTHGQATSLADAGSAGGSLDVLPGRMEQAVLAELRQYGREDSVSGVAALLMARQADHGVNTGSQLAMLMDKVQTAVAKAIAGIPPAGDWLDEQQKAYEAKVAAELAEEAG